MSDIVCISPVDGRIVDSRKTLEGGAIDAALRAARAAQLLWKHTPLDDRITAALAFLDAMLAMNHEIVPELAWQMGRPVRYGGEARSLEERVRYMARQARAFLAPLLPPENAAGIERYVQRDPLGLVFTIAPWNYPYLTAVNSIVPALIAGNGVLLKHAAQTILVGDRFQAAFDKAGLPKGLFQTLALNHDDTARMIAGRCVDMVCFTGSTAAGRTIERAAAGTFAGVGLELGGKDPAYVRADANLDHAIENIVDGAFFNSGQSCCGVERIYVHDSVYDRFIEGAAALTARYALGDPLDPTTTLGPLAQVKTADLVRAHVADARARGARALIDASAFPADKGSGTYLAPQLLVNVDHSMRVMTEESFGPVVGVMKVKTDAEAIALMNDSAFGLTASVWTSDLEAARRIGGEIETGTVYMNRCDYLDPALAWTGVKDTGKGATLSRIGFEMLTQPKSFHLRKI